MSSSSSPVPVRHVRSRLALVTGLTILVAAVGLWDWLLVTGARPAWLPVPASVIPAAPEPDAPPVQSVPMAQPSRAPARAPAAGPSAPADMPVAAPPVAPAAVPKPTYIWRMTPPPVGSTAAITMHAPGASMPVASAAVGAAPTPQATPADRRKVSAIILNLRAGPSASTERIARLPFGTIVTVLEAPGRWVRVATPDGLTGWVSSRYLRPH
jgi:hypothetical protein